MSRPKGPPPTLPYAAERILREWFPAEGHSRVSYQTALANLQRFAEEEHFTDTAQPLAPQAIPASLLVDYFKWLRKASPKPKKKEKEQEDQQPREGENAEEEEKPFADATVRLYLTVALQYLESLEAERLLVGTNVAELKQRLDQKIGRRGRGLHPARRSSDDSLALLLVYFAAQLKTFDKAVQAGVIRWSARRTEQHRLILLRNHALMNTLYATAGRASEVVGLQRADAHEGEATHLRIRKGKGNKERMVFLNPAAKQAIGAYLQQRGPDGFSPLFVSHSHKGGESLSTTMLWKIVNTAVADLTAQNLIPPADPPSQHPRPKHLGPHSFRHLRAQHLLDEGLPLPSLQTYLGHSSIATTRDTYAPITDVDQLAEQVATYGLSPEKAIARAARRKPG